MYRVLLTFLFGVVFMLQQSLAQMYVKAIRANDTLPLKETIPVPYTAKVEECYEYKDAAGLHLLLATATADGKNFLCTCYTKTSSTWTQDWQIKDYSTLAIAMADDYTKITDIDGDGVYETIIVYTYPAGDNAKLGGNTWKLLLHYKNKKYAIRAHQKDSDYDEPATTMDESFNTLPKSIKKYVIEYWNKLANDQSAMKLLDPKK